MIDAHDKEGSISLKSRISKLLFAGFWIVSLSANIQTIKLMQSRSNDAPSISPIAFESQLAAQASDPLDTVAQAGEVPNDDIDHATSIDALPFSDSLDITNATTAADDPVTTCGASDPATQSKSVWYVFVPEERSRIKVSTVGSGYDTVVNVWTGTRGNLISRTCDYDTEGTLLRFWAYQDTTYYIEVMAYGDTPGGQLEFSVELQPPPPNDDFDDAIVIETLPFFDDTDTALATTASDDPATTCGDSYRATQSDSVWYVLVTDEDSRIRISTVGSDYYTVVQVWTGTRGNLTPVACKYDYEGTLLRFWAIQNTTYYIEVMAYGYDTGGQLEFSVELEPPPPNDDFNDATIIETIPFFDNPDTALATTASDDPATTCGSSDPATQSHSIWYQYTPAEDMWLEARTFGSDYNTVLQVWTGERGALSPVACNDDGTYWQTSELIFKFLKDVTYHIEVMSYGDTEGGQLELRISIEPPPSNDDFDNARKIKYLPYSGGPNTLTATTAPDDPSPSCGASEPSTQSNSVWYRFDAPNDGALEIHTEGSDYVTVVTIWDGERGDLGEEACIVDPSEDTPLVFPVYRDDTYWVEVMQYGEPGGGNLIFRIVSTVWDGRAIGLRGDYFNNKFLQEPITLTRYNGRIAFFWGSSGPSQEVGNDLFSVRWTGYVEPEFSERYTFYTESDDGVRLWVNNQLLIDNWTIHGSTVDEGSIDLEAGKRYPIKLEYFEEGGWAIIILDWESPSLSKQLVPMKSLSYIAVDDSSATFDPTILPADGVSASTLTLNIKDSLGNIGKHLPVELYVSGSGNRINGTPVEEGAWTSIGMTDANGRVSAEVASIVAEEKEVKARVDNAILDVDATVTFTATAVTQLRVILPGEEPLPGQDPGKSGTAIDALVGQHIPFLVQAVDQYWNHVTDYSSTVNITSTDPAASLPESLEMVNGEAVGLVEWGTIGTHTLSAVSIEEPAVVGESTLDVVYEALTVTDGEVVTLDDARYALNEVLEAGEDRLPYDGTEGFQPGDEVLIITMLGEDIGLHETNHLVLIEEDQIRLAKPLLNTYDGTRDKVMIQQVPYYPEVTVQSGGRLIAHKWDGNTGGVLFLRVSDLTVENGGEITVAGSGFNPSNNGPGAGQGGSHGGYGGNNNTGLPYGSVLQPITMGSAGTRTSEYGGTVGGGVIKLWVENNLRIDGVLNADASTSWWSSHGSAGGSIWLETQTLEGTGSIRANGCEAHTNLDEASGSGGRIAAYFGTSTFSGLWSASTDGEDQFLAGPGTIYLEDVTTGERKLLVDNGNLDGRQAVITDPGPTVWRFDEIELKRRGHLELFDKDDMIILTSENMTGDGTAQLHLHQELSLSFSELRAFELYMREDSKLILPETYVFRGGRLSIYGELTGVSSLVLSTDGDEDGTVRLGASGHSTDEEVGTFAFDQVVVEANQVLELASDVVNERGVAVIANSVTVHTGGAISADGLGYSWESGNPGPGVGGDEVGGGHGGYGGGEGGGLPYGSALEPVSMGSAGGKEVSTGNHLGCPGGGAVKLVIEDTLLVDGVLNANGISADERHGAGAGGSLWISAETLTGSGAIRANGGDSINYAYRPPAAGSGGRIALYYDQSTYTGILEAKGGGVVFYGGPGTIYIQDTYTGIRKLIVDNYNQDGPQAAILSDPGATTWSFDELRMIRYGHLELIDPEDEIVLTPENMNGDGSAQIHLHGTHSFGYSNLASIGFIVREDATLTLPSDFELDRVTLINEGKLEGVSSLTLKGARFISSGAIDPLVRLSLSSNVIKDSYARLTAKGHTIGDPTGTYSIATISIDSDQLLELGGDPASGLGVTLKSENITISGHVSADGLGYTENENGPGAPVGVGGAGHGGIGGWSDAGGDAYGSVTEPLALGSAASSSGGGAIKLIVSDTLVIAGTGKLSVNGVTSNSSSGAGGSIWIITDTIQGAGRIQANGGNTESHSSGAGGRIAAYFNNDQFTGTWEAAAGVCSKYCGGPGTLYFENAGSGIRELLVDNLGRAGQRAVISNPEPTVWELDKIRLLGYGHLELRDPDDAILLSSENMIGDRTAQLYYHGDLVIDQTELRTFGFHLFESATLTLQEDLSLHGVALSNEGTIEGLSKLELHGATFSNRGVIDDLSSLSLQSQDEVNSRALFSALGRSASQPQGSYELGTVAIDAAQRLDLESAPEAPLGVTILADNITVAGHISADGMGYPYGAPGPGEPESSYDGAGHGGKGGGENGGPTYGSAEEPTTLGSSSYWYGGVGAGAIHIILEGRLLLTSEAVISADGTRPSESRYGGGSGGSIWITSPKIEGNGTIRANGGQGGGGANGGGGGGGGRVKVEAGEISTDITIEALGGNGARGDGESGSAIVESIDYPTDVAVVKSGPEEIVAGMTFEYTLTVKNAGHVPAEEVTLTDTLPSEIVYLQDNAPVPVDEQGNQLTWVFGDLDPGEAVVFSVLVQSPAEIPEGTLIINTAEVSTTTDETDVENNIAQLETVFVSGYAFETDLEPAELPLEHGATGVFRINIENVGLLPDTYNVAVNGLEAEWFELSETTLSLAPGALSQIELVVRVEDCNVTGIVPFTIDFSAQGGGEQISIPAELTLKTLVDILDLQPFENATISSRDVSFSWRTKTLTTGLFTLFPVGQPNEEETYTSDEGNFHNVRVEALERNRTYEWRVEVTSACGTGLSDSRQFTVGNGIVFMDHSISKEIERDYYQHVLVQVENQDTVEHTLKVEVQNPYEDLIINFVGSGSIDKTITLSPGERQWVRLAVHAQDAKLKNYDLMVTLTADEGTEIPIQDSASIHLRVLFEADFSIEKVGVDPLTGASTYRVTNHGTTITDLSVTAIDRETRMPARVYLTPTIAHARLETDQSITFEAYPIFGPEDVAGSVSEGSPNVKVKYSSSQIPHAFYDIVATVAGIEQWLTEELSCPEGRQVYAVTRENACMSHHNDDWYCTNKANIIVPIDTPYYIHPGSVTMARLLTSFSSRTGEVLPHNVVISINGHEVGSLSDTIPTGTYSWVVEPDELIGGVAGTARQEIGIRSKHSNSGHYSVATDFELQVVMDTVTLYVCAGSQAEAESIVDNQLVSDCLPEEGEVEVYILEPIYDETALPNNEGFINLRAKVLDGSSQDYNFYTVEATLEYLDEEGIPSEVVAFYDSGDKGNHGDDEANDRIFSALWWPLHADKIQMTVTATAPNGPYALDRTVFHISSYADLAVTSVYQEKFSRASERAEILAEITNLGFDFSESIRVDIGLYLTDDISGEPIGEPVLWTCKLNEARGLVPRGTKFLVVDRTFFIAEPGLYYVIVSAFMDSDVSEDQEIPVCEVID